MTARAERWGDLLGRVHRLVASGGGRTLIGLCGAPGAGKTTVTEALVDELRRSLGADAVAHVPMDGYHLADVELRRQGMLGRKGAPETFDSAGYAALVGRLRDERASAVYAPMFERELEQPVAGAIAVSPAVRVVLTEGNYLLREDAAWPRARAGLDEVWFVESRRPARRRRLVERHVRFGKSAEAARRWVDEVDEVNAREIERAAARADVRVPPELVDGAFARLSRASARPRP